MKLSRWSNKDSKPPLLFFLYNRNVMNYAKQWVNLATVLGIFCLFVALLRKELASVLLAIFLFALLVLLLVSLMQRIQIDDRGISWKTFRGSGKVNWDEITEIQEVIKSSFFPVNSFGGSVLRITIEPGEPLALLRWHVESHAKSLKAIALPSRSPIRAPSLEMARHLFVGTILITWLMLVPGTRIPGISAYLVFLVISLGILIYLLTDLPIRWTCWLELSEEGLTYTRGGAERTILFTEVTRAERRTTELQLESVSEIISVPSTIAGYVQWEKAIAARLPEGVVIKDG